MKRDVDNLIDDADFCLVSKEEEECHSVCVCGRGLSEQQEQESDGVCGLALACGST